MTAWNSAAERAFGYSRDEALGRAMDELIIPPRLREAHRRGLARYLATGEERYFNRRREFPALRSSGEQLTVELVISRLPTLGPPLFAGFLRDITERKRREENARFLVEASRTLSSSLDYAQIAQELARLVVPRVADWCAVDLVEEAGLCRVAIAHRDPQKVSLAHELHRRYPPRADHPISRVLRSGQSMLVPEVSDELLGAIAHDARHLEIVQELGIRSFLVAPLVARDRVFGALTLVTSAESRQQLGPKDLELAEDVVGGAALAIDNARLYEQEQHAVRMREDMLAIVSHDLRNPLGVVATSGALLLRRLPGEERIRKPLEAIRRATDQMERLIRDLLDMASLQTGRLTVERKPHEAAPIAIEAFESHVPLAREKGLGFERDLRIDGAWILCDRERILQVFANLLGNALKFCRPGERVLIRAEMTHSEGHFAVADTGPGIATDELRRLFQPYWSAEQHARSGTGLGLYISKGIIEAHGGRIWVESTTFHFTVPRGKPTS